MKNLTYSKLLFLLLYSTMQLQADYWKENNDSWISWCYNWIVDKSLDNHIPELIMQRDCDTLTNPTHLQTPLCPTLQTCYNNNIYAIEEISSLIESGPTYQTLQQILQTIPLLTQYPLQLRHDICNILHNPISTGSCIILHTGYYQLPDAIKLFILYHELYHHLYNDIADNHLEKIINLQSSNIELQQKLQQHKDSLQQHIIRYVEYRTDMQAKEAIQCPYCLQEIAQYCEIQLGKHPIGNYNPYGYLYGWQFNNKIYTFLAENKCCKHHQNNKQQIDLSITDASSLLDRLITLNNS